jgi:polyhydroxyalkanoate synthesis regulator protein
MKVFGNFSIENGKITIQYSAKMSFLGIDTSVKDATIESDINKVIEEALVIAASSKDGNQVKVTLDMFARLLGITTKTMAAIRLVLGIAQ